MNLRKWAIAALVVTAISACSNPPPAPPPVSDRQLTEIKKYFADNPAEIPSGWSRGILIVSRQIKHDCLKGTCYRWEGAAVKNDGNVIGMASGDGNSEVYSVVGVGDDFMWTGAPDYRRDIRVVKQGVIAVTATATAPTS